MPSTLTTILTHIRTTLTGSGLFASVILGSDEMNTALPSAAIAFERQDLTPADPPSPDRHVRLQARLFITTRADRSDQAAARLADLAASATAALLADPTRGGCCCDLPIGRATEITEARAPRDERYPQRKTSLAAAGPTRELTLTLRCHYEQHDGDYDTGSLDAQALFASGPSELIVGSWTRQRLRRSLAGLDGEVVVDLGRRSRTLTQQGTLQAATLAGLTALTDAIDQTLDDQLHTLIDPTGRSFANVLIETFTQTSPARLNRLWNCQYTLTCRQLP